MATSNPMSTSNQYVKYTISVTQNSQNVTNNTSNVTVSVRFYRTNTGYKTWGSGTLTCRINGVIYNTNITPSQEITSSGIVLFSQTFDIQHNDDGTKALTCSAWISMNSPLTSSEQSYTQTLTTIPRSSALTVANGTLGVAQTLTVAKQASGFTHTITATCGSVSTTICSGSSETSISFTPPIEWAKQNISSTIVSVKYTITTYNGSTSVGSNNYSVTCSIPDSVKPTCNVYVVDAMAYIGGYIKGKSKLGVSITTSLAYDSPIVSYSTLINENRYSSNTFTTGVINTAGTIPIDVTVTDMRGRTGTVSTSVHVLDYAPPNVTQLNVKRCDSDGSENDKGEYVKVTFSAKVTSLNDTNSAIYSLRYKKSTETEWTSIDISQYNGYMEIENESCIFEADSGSSYNIMMSVYDNFESVSRTTVASTAATILHFKSNGRGIGIGKISEVNDTLEIGYATCFNGGILYPLLQNGTDLDSIMLPGFYNMALSDSVGYINSPLSWDTGTLFVESCGDSGQLRQRVVSCDKENPVTYERCYYFDTWGDWVNMTEFDGTLLWSGASHMNGGQTATLAELISNQKTGIVLVFSNYNTDTNTAYDLNFSTHFIPKMQIANHAGCGHTFLLSTNGDLLLFGSKYLVIYDGYISGNNNNTANGTAACGITYSNSSFVLRYVIGV